ncbi:MAG: DUF2860 family protein [Pseudomonadales bacterium]
MLKRVSLLLLVQLLAVQTVLAREGFHGFFFGGIGYTEAKTNTVDGNDYISIGNSRVYTFSQSPRSKSDLHPAFAFELSYGFKNGVELFTGTSLEDFLRFDSTTQIGARTAIDDLGQFSAGFVFAPLVTDVWSDPYLLGSKREQTDRTSKGVRLQWDQILGTGLGVMITTRKIEIDDERSGADPALGLTPEEIRLLDREGDQVATVVEYVFNIGERHRLTPSIRYVDRDRDGGAEKAESVGGQLNYLYNTQKFTFAANVFASKDDFDKANPIFGRDRDQDVWGTSATLFLPAAWAGERWRWQLTTAYGKADSDINFHDNEVWSSSVGLIGRW